MKKQSQNIHRRARLKSEQTPPYLRRSFWRNPANWFWESPFYSERVKQQFRERFAVILNHHTLSDVIQ